MGNVHQFNRTTVFVFASKRFERFASVGWIMFVSFCRRFAQDLSAT